MHFQLSRIVRGEFWKFCRKLSIPSRQIKTQLLYSGAKLTVLEWRSLSTVRRQLSTGAPQTGTGSGIASTNDEFVSDGPDDQSYMRGRWTDLKHMQDLDESFELYPHNFRTTTTIPEFNTMYQYLGPGERRPETRVALAGRVNTIRRSGKSLVFLELKGDGAKVQVFPVFRRQKFPLSDLTDLALGHVRPQEFHCGL
jgi:hypothetical protein